MPYELHLELPYLPPRLNVYLRWHFRKRHKINLEIQTLVEAALTGLKPKQPLSKYSLQIIRASPQFLDYDNCVASYKPVIDALCRHHSGVLEDDAYKMSGPWDVTQQFRAKKLGPLTTIIIKEK